MGKTGTVAEGVLKQRLNMLGDVKCLNPTSLNRALKAVVLLAASQVHPRTYVHRAGRTARAGATGAVYTLVRRQEARHFKELRRAIGLGPAKNVRLGDDDFARYEEKYEAALQELQAAVEAEGRGAKPKRGGRKV